MSLTLPLAIVVAALTAQQPRDVRATIEMGTAVLEGVVLADETPNRPLRRAMIGILGTDEAQVRLTLTDDAGRFVMPALPAGRYLVTASKPPYVDTVYGAKLPGRPGTAIALKEGERRTDLVLKMIRGGVITGVVTDEHGRPAVAMGVEIVQLRKRVGDQMLTSMVSALTEVLLPRQTTDDRGVYRFAGLPPGEYIVSATPVDLAGGDAVVQTAEEVQTAVRELETSPKPASKPASSQPPTSTVIGSEDRPQRPVQMSGPAFMNFSAGQSGGPSIRVRGPTIGYAPVYYPGTTSQADAAPITVGPGDERTDIDITARPVPMTRVDGIVVGPDGQPVPGVSIQMRAEDRVETFNSMFANLARSVTTRPDGTFTVTSLAPGRYTLQARQRLPATTPAAPVNPASPPSSAQGLWASVEVFADGQPITGLTLTLQAGMTISGRVVLDGASKQSTVDFSAINIMAAPARPLDLMSLSRGAARIDADGTFTITGLIPGTYRLVGQSGPTPEQARGFWMDTSVRLGGREVSDLAFELRPGENITDAVITITDRQQQVSGTLQDASGRAATDYTMIMFPADRAYWLPDSRRIITARPGTDGRFAFLGLQGPPPGEYMIAAVTDLRPGEQFDPDFLAALLPQAFKVALGPGEIKTQDVRLVKAP